MRYFAWIKLIAAIAAFIHTPAYAQEPDDALRIYAVNVSRTSPQAAAPLISSGIYLGSGTIITAAHVVGPSLRVLIAGQELPADVIKQGSSETIDLALLSIDQTNLPVGLRLRRNPICEEPPKTAEIVIVVVSSKTERSRIKSLNGSNNFVEAATNGDSGSGVYRVQKACLLGILNSKISDFYYRLDRGRMVRDLGMGSIEVAKHFVPASDIVNFIPSELRLQ
jgi:hypothetical protein